MPEEKPQISIVVPLYNESASLSYLKGRLDKLIIKSPLKIEVVLVDDGSKDDTPQKMKSIALADEKYQCVFLARNYGHQIALSAGLASAKCTEVAFIIDGDLQDPPELLNKFYSYFKKGYDVVYGIRANRKESLFLRTAYYVFYRLIKFISYIHIPLDSGDFSLISRRVLNILNSMPEESRYIRGMRAWTGFKQIGLKYKRDERVAGETKYSVKKLFKLAYDGIFNFSEFPVKLITSLGFISIIIALVYLTYTLIDKLLYKNVPQGFTSLLFGLILFSGVQLISLGIIGEYVIRIFFQVKNRPLFIVKERISNKETTYG